jgi:lipocalin
MVLHTGRLSYLCRIYRLFFTAAAAIVLALMGPTLSYGRAEPVKSLDHEAYSGRWFQMYTTKYALKAYEKHGQCITSDIYVNEPDATMTVLNTQTVNSTEAPFFKVSGTIYSTTHPGMFNVVFPPASWVDHTIVALGPFDSSTGLYTYSIGTNHRNTDLVVLVRDVSNVDKSILPFLISNSSGLPPPVEIFQGAECNYAPFVNRTNED